MFLGYFSPVSGSNYLSIKPSRSSSESSVRMNIGMRRELQDLKNKCQEDKKKIEDQSKLISEQGRKVAEQDRIIADMNAKLMFLDKRLKYMLTAKNRRSVKRLASGPRGINSPRKRVKKDE